MVCSTTSCSKVRRASSVLVLAPVPGARAARGLAAWARLSLSEKLDGSQVREQEEPSDAFPHMALTVPWDPLQVVHLAAQLTWSYLVSPFIFAGDGFVTQELGPWPQGDEVWRRLEVRFPESLSAHSRLQTCYFDDRGLLRRQDYSVDAPGGQAMLDYPSAYREFDGIAVPTRRRAYVRGPDARRGGTRVDHDRDRPGGSQFHLRPQMAGRGPRLFASAADSASPMRGVSGRPRLARPEPGIAALASTDHMYARRAPRPHR